MKQSFHLADILGIPIEISYSWFIVFGLVMFTLARGYFPLITPETPAAIHWIMATIASLLLFISLLLHELSHSIVAKRNNLPISGITLFIFGGVAHMEKEPNSPSVELKMAIAGPICSLVLAVIFLIIEQIFIFCGLNSSFIAVSAYLFYINLIIAVFNLIPGFPLDGGRVLRAILWLYYRDLRRSTQIASNIGKGFAFIMMALGIINLISGSFLSGIWLIFIGLFLMDAAEISYKQVVMNKALYGIKIKAIMSPEVITVTPNITLKDLVDNYFFKFRHASFPVVEDDSVLGLVTLHDVKNINREEWPNTSTRSIMFPIEEGLTIHEDAEAIDALTKMAAQKTGRLLVIKQNRLVGIVSQRDITRLFEFKKDLDA